MSVLFLFHNSYKSTIEIHPQDFWAFLILPISQSSLNTMDPQAQALADVNCDRILGQLNAHLDAIDTRPDAIDTRLDAIKNILQQNHNMLTEMEGLFLEHGHKFSRIETTLDTLGTSISKLGLNS
jgi:hypothetical protein